MRLLEFLYEVARSAWALVSVRPWSIANFKKRWNDLESLVVSWGAMLARQMGFRAMLAIGCCASACAIFLFVAGQLAPSRTSASQDAVLKARWSSPAPSQGIVIVDVDERSLALLAPEYGRWPWPRSVLADGLQRVVDAGASAVLFNVMLSDPDKGNADADAAMEVTSALLTNVAFPAIRLNPQNDRLSQLKVSDLLSRTGDRASQPAGTVAMLLPMFQPMLARVGIANQFPDPDGVVRRYPLMWSDPAITMPSIVARTVALAGKASPDMPAVITLNWRNKKGRYTRISFADLLAAPVDDPLLGKLNGAVVVLGLSAPGLGQTKGTAVSSVEDDNEILATALDDASSGTHLRVLPAGVILVIELCAVWVLVWLSTGRKLSPILNLAFLGLQSGAASITMLSASYTSYLIDLTTPMAFGAGVFAAIKLVQSLDSGWSRARSGYRRVAQPEGAAIVLLLGYRDSKVTKAEAAGLQLFLEKKVGLSGVIRVDDLFGGESFAKGVCEDFSCQLVRVAGDTLPSLLAAIRQQPINPRLKVREIDLGIEWNPERDDFRLSVVPGLLRLCADMMEQ